MKTINKFLTTGAMACGLILMTACSPEEINGLSEGGIPQASDYQIGISVDELNNVELNILDKNGAPAVGVYPVWYINESTRPSTALTYRDLITTAGNYPVEMKVGNRNGVSEGSVTGTIVITQTIFDFSPYMRNLTNNSSKEWTVDGETPGHMGCGGSVDNPTEWWSASPNDKLAEGVYENILTFSEDGQETSGLYEFNPGEAGTFYVNKDVNNLPGYTLNNPNDGNDYRVAAGIVNTTFSLVPQGAGLYLELPADTPFPYVPSDAAFANPRYKITSITKSSITLVQELEGISWQYMLAPKGEKVNDVTTTGFDFNGEHNLWKNADVQVASTWFADGGWSELANQPSVEVTPTNGIKLTVPAETGPDQWQGQVHVTTNIPVSSTTNYDFSCKVTVPQAGLVTVKVQKNGDDETYFTADRVEVEPDGYIVWFHDLTGFDGDLKIAFDFGGYGGCDVEVDNIVFKESQYDDGTIIPASALIPVIPDEANLFAGFQVVNVTTWFADSSWNSDAIQQPEIIVGNDGYSFICPEGIGSDQWQGQVHLWTNVPCSAENKYDFSLVIESDQDISKVTVKVQKGDSLGADDADNDVAFSVDRVDVEGGVPYTYYFAGKQGFDTSNIQICMDYAGAPGKANITVSDIRMQVAK